MGTVVFVILRAWGIFDTDYDWPIGCCILSLDSIAFALFSLGSTLRNCLRPGTEGEAAEGAGGSEDETKTET